MLRPLLAALGILAALVTFPSTCDAFLWGIFGGDDKWKNMDPAEQDAAAQPIMDEAKALEIAGRLEAAIKQYRKVWKQYPGSKPAAEALFRTARLELHFHEWRRSFNAYVRLVRSYPENPYFTQIVHDMFEIGAAYEEGNDIHWLWVIPYSDENMAAQVYENVVATAPFSDYAPIALMRVAMIHKREGDVVLAVDALDRLINFYPTSMLSGDAHLLLAETFGAEVDGPEYDQGATREAISYYRDFLLLYPENPQVKAGETGLANMRDIHARSKLVMGEFYFKYRDDYAAAEVFFNESITIAPESSAAAEARVYLNEIARIKADYPESDWPRRVDWQYLLWWRDWPPPPPARAAQPAQDAAPATAPAQPAEAERPEPAVPTS